MDNSELLTGRSSLAMAPTTLTLSPTAKATTTAISPSALTRWISLRERTDESAWVLRWVGDRIAESQLRDIEDLSLFDQFESVQAELERRAEQHGLTMGAPWRGFDLHRAALDALSLSAVLDGALVLCSTSDGHEPAPVLLARQLQLTVTDVDSPEAGTSLFPTERQFLREALARAGLATLTQTLPPLAALHVCLETERPTPPPNDIRIDAEAHTPAIPNTPMDTDLDTHLFAVTPDFDPPDPWQHARIWWYRL
ncbi:hypothetical protein [Roseateles sp. YR242]|uniref:hypothetical protein n=1 Tax=Roseateles sp. YR242 TaxID=1855305 RepID=UPI001160AA94|nr:hypothetical protein [Roseateles sp. YR242]